MTVLGRFEPFARQGDSCRAWHIPKLPRDAAVYKKIQRRERRPRQFRRPPYPPAPRRPAGLSCATPHDRRRLRPDADRAVLVDVGAVGGDAADDVNGGAA
jgi:hypothetical protein